MNDIMSELFSYEDLVIFSSYNVYAYLLLTLIILWVGKKIYDFVTPFKLDHQLTTNDNKALAVSFTGYLMALGIIIWGVVDSPSVGFVQDLIEIGGWSLIGIVLLNIARVINDKVLLSNFDNNKEIIDDRNKGTGAVEFGSFVGTAFIIKSVIEGESSGDMLYEGLMTIGFFILGQFAFAIFGKLYQKITTYDIYKELEDNDNAAVGISYGLNLAAVGLLLSYAIEKSDSIVFFLIWFLIGIIVIFAVRTAVDRVIIPQQKIDDEISKDQNWGVALIEGSISIIVVLLLNSSF